MSRIAIPAKNDVPEASKPLVDAVEKTFGVVPNLFRLIALSPHAMAGFLANDGALGKTLDVKTRNRIAVAVAQADGCDYCLSAHSYLGANLAKLDEAELAANRRGTSNDAKAAVAVAFATKVVTTRGKVDEADVPAVRAAGYTDAQIVEIIAVVAENFFTNILNNAIGTDIDFPVVRTAS